MTALCDTVKKRYKVNLPGQQLECEVNYQRLLQLLPAVHHLLINDERYYIVGNNPAAESVIGFTVLEQTKYTSVVHIVQFCSLQNATDFVKYGTAGATAQSASQQHKAGKYHKELIYQGDVRLYHDVCMAEVVKCQRFRHFAPRYEYPNLNMHQIDEKAQMNRFLGELLSHCLSYGRVSDGVVDDVLSKVANG